MPYPYERVIRHEHEAGANVCGPCAAQIIPRACANYFCECTCKEQEAPELPKEALDEAGEYVPILLIPQSGTKPESLETWRPILTSPDSPPTPPKRTTTVQAVTVGIGVGLQLGFILGAAAFGEFADSIRIAALVGVGITLIALGRWLRKERS